MAKITQTLGFISCALPIFLAILGYYAPAWLLMIAPIPLDDWILRKMYPKNSNGHDPNYWAMDPFLTELQHKNISSLEEIFHPQGYPILSRNYVEKFDIEPLLERLLEANNGKKLRVFNFTEKLGTNHISACGGLPKKMENMNFEDFAGNLEGMKNLYAGFESLTDIQVINELFGHGVDFSKLHPGYKQNNIFFSNFQETLMSAGMHCSPIDSLAVQLVGKKTWLLASPEQLSKLPSIPLPTFFPVGLNDDQTIDAVKHFIVVKAGPGDALYFGPNWCHAVISHEGPNVMFNLRYFAREKVLASPLGLLLKVLFRKMTRTFGGNPQDNSIAQGPIYETVNNLYENCGKSNRLEQIVDYFANLEW